MTPCLIIWNIDNMRLQCIWKDQFKGGISNCCFSNDGKSVCAIGMDDDHSIGVYDVDEAIKARKDPKNKSLGLMGFGKLTKQEIFDVKFAPGDWQIVVACMKEINIVTWRDGKVMAERGIWKEQQT